MPSVVSLNGRDVHRALTKFLEHLRQAFKRPGVNVCIDFSATEKVLAEGMLLFYAELTRLVDAFGQKRRTCRPAHNTAVDEVLQHLGVYELLGHRSSVVPSRQDVVLWRHARARQVDGAMAGELLENYTDVSNAYIGNLYRSVSEAITNVSNHSHIAERFDKLNLLPTKEWWMFCRQDDDRLYVAVCDLGIGIPRSLPKVHTWEVVHEALARMFGNRRPTDGHMIKAALRLRRTRTQDNHRGLGFNDILQVLQRVEGSLLRIYSNRGKLTYRMPSLKPSIKVRTFKNSILGTILIWSFPLKGTDHGH